MDNLSLLVCTPFHLLANMTFVLVYKEVDGESRFGWRHHKYSKVLRFYDKLGQCLDLDLEGLTPDTVLVSTNLFSYLVFDFALIN